MKRIKKLKQAVMKVFRVIKSVKPVISNQGYYAVGACVCILGKRLQICVEFLKYNLTLIFDLEA